MPVHGSWAASWISCPARPSKRPPLQISRLMGSLLFVTYWVARFGPLHGLAGVRCAGSPAPGVVMLDNFFGPCAGFANFGSGHQPSAGVCQVSPDSDERKPEFRHSSRHVGVSSPWSDDISFGRGRHMHTAVRPYATAGVALVGASVIAVAPMAPPLPDIHVPHVSAAVELTQFVNPITTLVQVIQTSVMNATALGAIIAADPLPILTQIITNQIANAGAIATGVNSSVMSLVSNLMGLPAQLQGVVADLMSGDIFDAVQSLLFEIPFGLLLGPLLDLTGPLLTVATQTTQNLANAVSVLSSSVLLLGIGVLEPIFSVVNQIGTTGQSLFDAVTTGDFVSAASDLINFPILLIGAALNGTPDTGGQGILTPEEFGTIATLYSVLQSIAASLTGVPPAFALGAAHPGAAPNASPNLAAKTVTLTTAPPVNTPAVAVTTPPTVKSGPAAKVLTPVNTTPTTTAPTTATASGGLASAVKAAGNEVSSTLSKIGAGLAGGSGHVPKHAK